MSPAAARRALARRLTVEANRVAAIADQAAERKVFWMAKRLRNVVRDLRGAVRTADLAATALRSGLGRNL